MINPYYSPEELGLTLHSIDEENGSYDFNTICFWLTPDKQVYEAADSGCSCPTPFEGYEASSLDDFKQKTQRIRNVEHGLSVYDGWYSGVSDDRKPTQSVRNELEKVLKGYFTT